jgi:hypothetical protein
MLSSISAPWLDHLNNWMFVAMFPLALAVAVIVLPLRRAWLYESRQWAEDQPRSFLDEILVANKTGESFGRWLTRHGYRWVRVSFILMWPIMLFIFAWPIFSKDFCSINKCKGRPAPVTAPSQ